MVRFEDLDGTGVSAQDGQADGSPRSVDDSRVIQRLEDYVTALGEGRSPGREELLEQYPEIAGELAACLDALELVHRLGPQLDEQPPGAAESASKLGEAKRFGTLGDFRILRQIGQGGMGVVYEAEQISLHRRVALKVLPFAAVLDQKQLQRFKNEALAAASLDHPNIVHVHSVGCERGVHYYAMQYIEGRTLAQVINQLRQDSGLVTRDAQAEGAPRGGGEASSDDRTVEFEAAPEPDASPSADTDREAQARASTEGSHRTPEFFRSVARLGIQAAEALEHAHQLGVVHRDIKPSNLMVDTGGHLWVTDFGLAHTRTGADITMTGDVLGTLRYMSPEQAAGKSRALDHHTDIYSLGVTLYELVTLQPAFASDDRQKLLREIGDEEPQAPRQVNKAVPKDLETIVLKATAKEPEARYATAQELADDLKRYLEDKPIQAKRPMLVQRAAKWARRHRPAVCSAAVGLLIAAVVAAAIAWNGYQRRVELERAVGEHLAAARALLQSQDYTAAERQLAEARGRLEVAQYRARPLASAVAGLSDEVSAKVRAQERFDQFQQLREEVSALAWHSETFLMRQAAESCLAALKLYRVLDTTHWQDEPAYQDLDEHQQEVVREAAAELLFLRARLEVKTAFDEKARAAAHRAAIDALRRIETFRQPVPAGYLWMADSWQHLGEERLAADARERAESLPPTTALDFFALGEFQHHQGQFEQALQSYSMALRCKPDHFLSLYGGGYALTFLFRNEAAEAMLTGAIAVNPHSGIAYIKRGENCMTQGKLDQARADFAKAAELTPESARPYISLGELLTRQGDLAQAIDMYNKALELNPHQSVLLARGIVYAELGAHDKAITDLTAAIERASVGTKQNPDRRYEWWTLARSRFHRANMLERLGERERALNDFRGAIEPLGKSIELPPSTPSQQAWAYRLRGDCYTKLEQYDNALDDYSKALELLPSASYSYKRRGFIYYKINEYEEAIADLNKAVELNPDDSSNVTWIAPSLVAQCPDQTFRDGIIDLAGKAIELTSGSAGSYCARARIYASLSEYDKSAADYDKALQIDPQYAFAYWARASLRANKGDVDAAIADYQKAVGLGIDEPALLNDFAWLLVAGSVEQRDPEQALPLAQKAVEAKPESHVYLNTLGVVYYRLRQLEQAAETLGKATQANEDGGTACDFFFLAMAHWQLDHKDEARKWYDKAVEWMEKNKPDDEEIRRFRDEAEQLFGLTEQPTSKEAQAPEKEKSSPE